MMVSTVHSELFSLTYPNTTSDLQWMCVRTPIFQLRNVSIYGLCRRRIMKCTVGAAEMKYCSRVDTCYHHKQCIESGRNSENI